MSSVEKGSLFFLASVLTSSGLIARWTRALLPASPSASWVGWLSAVAHSIAGVPSNPAPGRARVDYWLRRQGEGAFLEEVEGAAAMQWVAAQNERTQELLGNPKADPLYGEVLAILDSKDKIPHVRRVGDHYYNFWVDEQNPRGLWRRTSLRSYCRRSKPLEWELVLDVDALGRQEGESWVWAGHTPYHPDDPEEAPTRSLVMLSRGGSDAKVVREFDLVAKQFVPEGEGFRLNEPAKCRVAWLTRDTLLIGTNFDGVIPGVTDSLTDSGYPRLICEWRRGTTLAEAAVKFEGERTDVAVTGYVNRHRGFKVEVRDRAVSFYASQKYVRICGEGGEGGLTDEWHELRLPQDAEAALFGDQLLVTPRSPWRVHDQFEFAAGSVVACSLRAFLESSSSSISSAAGGAGDTVQYQALFTPSARVALSGTTTTQNCLLLHTLENVKSRVTFWRYSDGSGWECVGAEESAGVRGLSLSADDVDRSDLVWMTRSSFLTPSSLYLIDAAEGPACIARATLPVKSLPVQFDSAGFVEEQGEAVSADGERIPFFVISRGDGKPRGADTPCLLYGYGGFEISMLPNYLGAFGKVWLEQGHTYVVANIRGGGEFGPDWHKAALKANRNKAYEDFIAVAEALVSRGIASSAHLAIRGGSNGGLLMGNMFVQRPDLFRAVVCQVPLLDMHRYSKLLAGASWVAEYGDPDVAEEWAFLQAYSAYHNIDPSGSTQYPHLLMTSSMKDDRVHPYHARSFTKRLIDITTAHKAANAGVLTGEQSVRDSALNKPSKGDMYYYENVEGGHAGAADSKQQAYVTVLLVRFLEKCLS